MVVGMTAVGGMALAKAHRIIEQEVDIEKKQISQVDAELERLRTAVDACSGELSDLIDGLQADGDADHAGILDFQLLLLEDDNYIGRITRMIGDERVNCEYAVAQCSSAYRSELSSLDNAYLNERTADITDLEKRLLQNLAGKEKAAASSEPYIAVALDMTPSQVIEMGNALLKGIVLEQGGMSSHCVILARSMGIPCIIGASGALEQVREGQELLLDAKSGLVILSPSQAQLQEYREYAAAAAKERDALAPYRRAETATADGKAMKVYANITSAAETDALLEQGGEGVGLLRTEMLYMESDAAPDEETQFAAYSSIVKALNGRLLIVRTLDVGGDKHIPYLHIPQEDNPFLGYRAIRYCLDHPEIFHTQIAAILRAATFGPVQLMLPMIADVSEVARARQEIQQVREALLSRGVAVGEISVGMMVETPAAAVMADKFAEAVDFFSIGTNDLTQYLFAADRNNAKVAALNSYFQPALLRMVDRICRCASDAGIEVGICGQAGEVEELIPLWVGMGVNELSVSIPSIPRVRRKISQCNTVRCRELVDHVLQLPSGAEAIEFIREEVSEWS